MRGNTRALSMSVETVEVCNPKRRAPGAGHACGTYAIEPPIAYRSRSRFGRLLKGNRVVRAKNVPADDPGDAVYLRHYENLSDYRVHRESYKKKHAFAAECRVITELKLGPSVSPSRTITPYPYHTSLEMLESIDSMQHVETVLGAVNSALACILRKGFVCADIPIENVLVTYSDPEANSLRILLSDPDVIIPAKRTKIKPPDGVGFPFVYLSRALILGMADGYRKTWVQGVDAKFASAVSKSSLALLGIQMLLFMSNLRMNVIRNSDGLEYALEQTLRSHEVRGARDPETVVFRLLLADPVEFSLASTFVHALQVLDSGQDIPEHADEADDLDSENDDF